MIDLRTLEHIKRVYVYFEHSSLVDPNLYFCLIADAQGKIIFSDRDVSLDTAFRAIPFPPLLTVFFDNNSLIERLFPKNRGYKTFLNNLISKAFRYSRATLEQLTTPESAYLQIRTDYFSNLPLIPYRHEIGAFRQGDSPTFKYSEMTHQIDYMIKIQELWLKLVRSNT